MVNGKTGEKLVLEATEIRKVFARSLQRKVEGDTYRSDRLANKLTRFAMIEVIYSVKRRLQTKQERSQHFVSPTLDALGPRAMRKLEESEDMCIEDGTSTSVGDFLRIGVVPSACESMGTSSEFVATKWACPSCKDDFYSSSAERLLHIQGCNKEAPRGIWEGSVEHEDQSEEAKKREEHNPLKKDFSCQECGKKLWLTPVEILKHKRAHLTEQKGS